MIMWGWGAMNPTAVKEAAKTGFPMDHIIGVWWSGSEDDARPAGPGGKGYLSLNFNAVGANFPAIQDIQKYVIDKGKSQIAPKDKVGENFYNRGVMNSVLIAEAIRNAQKITGKKDITGEEMRRGLETLNITPARWKEIGLAGFAAPVKVTCADHNGHGGLYAAVGRHQVGQGLRLDRAHEGQGGAADRQRRRGLCESQCRLAEAHRALRQVVVSTAIRRMQSSGIAERLPPFAGGERSRVPEYVIAHVRRHADRNRACRQRRKTSSRSTISKSIYDHVILVLKGVSLVVPKGGIVALLGANGAGKTTTLKAISNLLHAERGDVTKGSIVFEGDEVQELSPNELVRRGCIQVMEGRQCFAHLTVEENLLTGAFTRRDGRAAIRAGHRTGLFLFPEACRAAAGARRLHLRRRAADVRHRPRADVAPEDDPARRAVDGAGAADRRGDFRDRRRT